MDNLNLLRLQAIGTQERYEKWLADRDDTIRDLIFLPSERWTKVDILMAQAVIAMSRTLLKIEKARRNERAAR